MRMYKYCYALHPLVIRTPFVQGKQIHILIGTYANNVTVRLNNQTLIN